MLRPGSGTTTTVKGLINGDVYTFTIAAENGLVVGPASVMTAPVTVGTPAAGRGGQGGPHGQGNPEGVVLGRVDQRRADHHLYRDLPVVERGEDQVEGRPGGPADRDRSERGEVVHLHRQGHQQSRQRRAVSRHRGSQGLTDPAVAPGRTRGRVAPAPDSREGDLRRSGRSAPKSLRTCLPR